MLQPLSHAATMLRACFIAADTGRDRNFLRGQLSENTFQKFPLVGAELSPSCLKGGFEIGVEEFSREALKWMDNAGGGARSILLVPKDGNSKQILFATAARFVAPEIIESGNQK